ncbi:hypothetical protein CCO03_17315 [Comamonas serinivorans]|uniref:Glycosyltransferase subfamily 4-like N-terminal domain-containing protein n=1 Tax=Comamonas serinivorans TaxID=1082851 RepID=A0A1Y0ESB8_9BURK|nr:glycosyltransferase [Comamonas serinivorans]ARU06199.1 hypothetical protein CCO03_17315 [Comamonas serinivorans]
MHILLAMCVMAHRTGAELFVRDVALALLKRGHTVTVYAPVMGEMVDELRAQCVACITDLRAVAQPPDLIVGNTHDETVACLLRFAGVPAISICHDRTAPHGRPPRFTRIRQYIAVDENCAERLYLEHGIARADIAIVGNGVDLQRFVPRRPLPAQPMRAAIFSNYATHSAETAVIRAACAARGLTLDVIGAGVGQQARSPELLLGQYDLVFAKARAAMEAMAVGCAVILFNENMGLGGLVTPAHMQDWHRWNFGRRLLRQAVTPESVDLALGAYRPQDAATVSAYVREHASLPATVQHLEALALQVLADEAARPPVSAEQELQEVGTHAGDLALQLQDLHAQLSQTARHAHALNEELTQVRRHREALLASASWRITAPLRWLAARSLERKHETPVADRSPRP